MCAINKEETRRESLYSTWNALKMISDASHKIKAEKGLLYHKKHIRNYNSKTKVEAISNVVNNSEN
jgi:hypothetical protein